jgi:Cu2+-exporting ATPase
MSDSHTASMPDLRREWVIEGIRSPQAQKDIEHALAALPELRYARLNLTNRRLTTEWAKQGQSAAVLLAALDALGYRAVPFTQNEAEAAQAARTQWLLRCLGVAGFAAMNVMLLSVSVWSGNATEIAPETRDLFHWLSALIALPAAGFAGQPFFYAAIAALRERDMTMDVPISLGVLLALGMSVYETAVHAHHAYFDSALMLLFFLLLGRVLDHVMRLRTRALAANLAALRAPFAHRLKPDGSLEEVPADALQSGDVMLVAAGERLAADGTVIEGRSDMDDSFLTGESMRRMVSSGDSVFAGMMNGAGQVRIKVAQTGAHTVLAEIEDLMDKALHVRSRYVQIADRIARIYAPVVHVTAALTALGWILAGASLHDAIIIAIAVLIITCPCALALAAPAVQVVVSGGLFRHGLLMRAGDVIERMADVDYVVFDKTGTLTVPDPAGLDLADLPPDRLIIAARLAMASRHPLARALGAAVQAQNGALSPLANVTEVTGQGVEALYEETLVRLGSPAFCQLEMGPDPLGQAISHLAFRFGEQAWCIRMTQTLRIDAVKTVADLKAMGLEVMILSGDHQEAVRPVAEQLAIKTWQGCLSPADKLTQLQKLRAAGHTVLMVGDGLNDAPSLAAASVSISPASGADVTQAAADLVFMGERLGVVPLALRLCRKGRRVMVENFLLALVYNLLAVPLAMAGLVTPLIAAAAMSGSSVLVALNALRARHIATGVVPDTKREQA